MANGRPRAFNRDEAVRRHASVLGIRLRIHFASSVASQWAIFLRVSMPLSNQKNPCSEK